MALRVPVLERCTLCLYVLQLRLFTPESNQFVAGPAPVAKARGRTLDRYATALAVPFKKASRSALTVSASVVGMPCGKPL
jgi:hypothetical protein